MSGPLLEAEVSSYNLAVLSPLNYGRKKRSEQTYPRATAKPLSAPCLRCLRSRPAAPPLPSLLGQGCSRLFLPCVYCRQQSRISQTVVLQLFLQD